MSLPVELLLGLRYTRARKRNHFISFISLLSMAGIALGVMALIVVISVMNGFEQELRSRILGMVSHVTLSEYDNTLSDWPALQQRLSGYADVSGVAPYIEVEAMLSRGSEVSGAIVRGVDPHLEPDVSDVHEHMLQGAMAQLEAGSFGIILGSGLAQQLGVIQGDRVALITPQSTISPIGILPRMRAFTVVGLFEIGVYEYDRSSAIIHVEDAAKLYRMQGQVNGLRVKLNDMDEAPWFRYQLQQEWDSQYWISDWTRKHSNYFQAVQTEKTVMFIILSLIVAVAAFNIVSTLVMVVTDKQADIAILRTIGLSPASVSVVFMVQGALLGIVGTLLGMALGVAIASHIDTIIPALEQFFQTRFLPEGVYPITELPAELKSEDVIKITLLSFLISILATLYPAFRGAKTHPAEALRYE